MSNYMKNLNIQNNELYIGKHKLSEIGKKFGTPLYVFDEDDLNSKMRFYNDNFNCNYFHSKIVYASKAFLVPAICELLKKNGLYMDAMSITDMEIARFANFNMSHVVFHGNNKSNTKLEYAVENEIGYIVVDNLNELERLIKIAKQKRKVVNTLFRVNPLVDAHTHAYIQTALTASKFGEAINDDNTIDKIIKTYLNNSYVKLLGFHAHIGSQIKESEPFLLLAKKMVEFSKKIITNYNIELTTLNLGGGFGIEYYKYDEKVDLAVMLKQLAYAISEEMQKNKCYLEDVMIEPGRSIVGPACLTLYECGITKKTIGGKNFLFIDGGMTDNIRPALYQAKYEALLANKVESNKKITVDVVGKCCESGDFIIKDALLPTSKVGDYLAVFATGAYNYSMFINYNGHLKPSVVFVGKDDIRVVSKKQSIEDVLNLYK